MSKFRFECRVFPAWDRRDSDPRKDYGILGAEMFFDLLGPKGGVRLLVSTNWYLKGAQVGYKTYTPGAVLSFHSPKILKGFLRDKCDLLPGGFCCGSVWYDRGCEMLDLLIEKGSTGLRDALISIYDEQTKAN